MADYALVVGISRYPGLVADGVSADLAGPDHDALAVRDWLLDPQGGRLDPANVKLIQSAQFDPLDPDDPQPARSRVERALKRIEEQTRDVPGDRLYLYFSGHGFSPVFEEGAILTAEATRVSTEYVYAHAWLRWFRKAQHFRESVLWMDACMNSYPSVPVNEINMAYRAGTRVPGPAFIALAAQTRNALECEMPDGRVHGVFTWTLLQGLRGGASDTRGRITGESLRTFLHNAMPEFLPEEARRATAVDLQPFVRADEGMVFQRLAARPLHAVRLALPGCTAGQELRIWSGGPHAPVVSDVLTGPEWSGPLVRGLYVVEVADAGVRQGFQVSGAGDVSLNVTAQGPPVTPSDGSELYTLQVVADNPAASIIVTDSRFDRVSTETGRLDERHPTGIYKVRVQFGRDITTLSEDVVLLDRDLLLAGPTSPRPLLLPSAPVAGTGTTHESHVAVFAQAQRPGSFPAVAGARSAISVIARYWTDPGAPQPSTRLPHPMTGLQLFDAEGSLVADLSDDCRVEDGDRGDPVAVWERAVPEGGYVLRQTLATGAYEGSVVASRDWVTQVALRRPTTAVGGAPAPGEDRVNPPDDAAVFLRRVDGDPVPPEQDGVLEAARLALVQGRDLFGEGKGAQLQELLLTTYDDPVAILIGAHLLLRAAAGLQSPDPARELVFDRAVQRLRGLVGTGHPDVEALSLRCADSDLRTTARFLVPPMFSESWRLITEATYESPELVPPELWARVHAWTTVGPFFVWAVDEPTRAAHARQLTQWVEGADDEGGPEAAATGAGSDRPLQAARPSGGSGSEASSTIPSALRDAGRRSQVPAAAAAVLWEGRSVSR
jgi:caspase domain-containing protein